MPLSEHEEKILAEIERQLADEDPRFVARARRRRSHTPWSRQARMRAAVALGLVGVICVSLLVVSIAFGAIGMVLIFGAIVLAVVTKRQSPARVEQSVPPDERA